MNTGNGRQMGKQAARSVRFWALCVAALPGLMLNAPAQAVLNESCVVSVLNRTVQVKVDGSWVLPNIPANMGAVRARAICVQNGTTSGQSGRKLDCASEIPSVLAKKFFSSEMMDMKDELWT